MMDEAAFEDAISREWTHLIAHAASDVPRASPATRRPSRTELWAELEHTRERFAALRGEPAEGLRRPATSGWSRRELLAHLASWAAEFVREVEALLAGARLEHEIAFETHGGPRTWNEAQVRRRRDASVEQIFEEFDRATVRLQAIVLDAADEALYRQGELPIVRGEPATRWQASIAEVILAKCGHDHYHLGGLERADT